MTVIVWFDGPIAKDDSVGLTKKPLQPDANVRSSRTKTAEGSEYYRSEVHII